MAESTPNVQGDRGSNARSREGPGPRVPNAQTRGAIDDADRMVAERSARSEDGSELIKSAHEALAIAEGKAEPAGVYVRPTVDVASIRKRLGLTQAAFADRFGVPVRTLRD